MNPEYLTDVQPNVDKTALYTHLPGTGIRNRYQAFGEVIGKAFRIGLELEQG